MALGPPLLGVLLLMANGTIKIDKRRLSLLYPFHKEALFGAFGVNVLLII